MQFSKVLRQWYLQNKRDLPWRATKNPYAIWLSEIILQQTRIDQGLSYYLKFIKAFPELENLANASEEEVLNLWQGLGYYSRARNLHSSAKYIASELQGKFTSAYSDILKLKGVGDYTASAISSICFNEPNAVVDGNVYRVLARYFGVSTPIDTAKGKKEFKSLAQELIDPKDPGTHNQSIMEFGARQCKPQNPLCNTCPISNSCKALATKKVNKLPVKKGKVKVRKRHLNYLVLKTAANETVLNKRTQGIWTNLYEFPLIESEKALDKNDLLKHAEFMKLVSNSTFEIDFFNCDNSIHKLSHQHLFIKFWTVSIGQSHLKTIAWKSIEKYPVPVVIDKFVKQLKNNCFF